MKYLVILLLCLSVCNAYAIDVYDLSNEICKDSSTDEQKVIALREAVYNKMKPYGNGHSLKDLNNHSLEWAWENGVGWCNHQCNVFMALAREQGITTRLIYLLTKDMSSSPHTIAEARLGNRWVVVDVGNNIDFRYHGRMATRGDMAVDFSIVLDNPKVIEIGGDAEYWRMFINQCYEIKVLEP